MTTPKTIGRDDDGFLRSVGEQDDRHDARSHDQYAEPAADGPGFAFVDHDTGSRGPTGLASGSAYGWTDSLMAPPGERRRQSK